MSGTVLLTGGAGYIGSHTCLALLQAGFSPVVVDNFHNSHPAVLMRLEKLTGRRVPFHHLDVRDREGLGRVLAQTRPDAVMHFAGLKAVGDSVRQPLEYYAVNVEGALSLASCMRDSGAPKRIIFSSSATVYGEPDAVPIGEDAPLRPTNPYGWSKVFTERMLLDLHASDPDWAVGILRYFNPVAAHESGLLGEAPRGEPNNLMPSIAHVALGRRPRLKVFGSDYPTPDGTAIRDYIHVMDLAEGHVAALARLLGSGGVITANLGTGRGYSVLEVVRAFEAASGLEIPLDLAPRRPGDVPECYAAVGLARELLGWEARRGLQRMCADAWRWLQANPEGYLARPGRSASSLA